MPDTLGLLLNGFVSMTWSMTSDVSTVLGQLDLPLSPRGNLRGVVANALGWDIVVS